MDLKKRYAKEVTQGRKRMRWNQKQLAEATDMTQAAISRIENQEGEWDAVRKFFRLCKVLEIDPRMFLKDD